jgi:hypothetical protein
MPERSARRERWLVRRVDDELECVRQREPAEIAGRHQAAVALRRSIARRNVAIAGPRYPRALRVSALLHRAAMGARVEVHLSAVTSLDAQDLDRLVAGALSQWGQSGAALVAARGRRERRGMRSASCRWALRRNPGRRPS